MVVFGPAMSDNGSFGLAVAEAEDEQELRDFAANDPVVTTGTAQFEVGRMLAGFVRPRPLTPESAVDTWRRSGGLTNAPGYANGGLGGPRMAGCARPPAHRSRDSPSCSQPTWRS